MSQGNDVANPAAEAAKGQTTNPASDPKPVRERAAAATKRARDVVDDAVASAKESAVGAFDKLIDSVDSWGNKRD